MIEDIFTKIGRNSGLTQSEIEELRMFMGANHNTTAKLTNIKTLDEITYDLGDMIAGRFISPADPNDNNPDSSTFTGTYQSSAGIVGKNAGTTQFQLNSSDGSARAAAGIVRMDVDGVTIEASDSFESTRSYKFKDVDSSIISALFAQQVNAPAKNYLYLKAFKVPGVVGYDGAASVIADCSSGKTSTVSLSANYNEASSGSPYVQISNNNTSKLLEFGGDWNGWIEFPHTCTYASASTFTLDGNFTSFFTKGLKLRWAQTTTKYGVVVSSSYSSGTGKTTVTIAVNTSYTIANAAIASISYSHSSHPYNWPDYFTWSPTWTNLSVGNGTQNAIVRYDGNVCKFSISVEWAAASATTAISGAVSFTPPVTANTTHDYLPIGAVAMVNLGTALYMGEAVYISAIGNVDVRVIYAAGTYAVCGSISSTVPFTWAEDDLLTIDGTVLF